MLYVSSTFLLLVNAVTFRRVRYIFFNRVAILILLFYEIIWCDTLNIALLDSWEGIYDGLFHSTFTTHSFALFLCIIRAIVFQLTVYYPRHSQKSMGAMGKKMSSFLLTQYTDNYFGIYQNNIIKMWEKFIIIELAFIILFILIGQIFLMQNVNSFLGYWVSSFFIYPFLLAAIIPIKSYSNAEVDKDKILSDNKNKSGIYMWTNLTNGKRYIGSELRSII